jgi:hypothetical protein
VSPSGTKTLIFTEAVRDQGPRPSPAATPPAPPGPTELQIS